MSRLQLWLGCGLLLSSAWAADDEAPSMELLLYLADWGTDADGRLIDPLDVPDSSEHAASPAQADPRPSTPEYPR